MSIKIEDSWKQLLNSEFNKNYFKLRFLDENHIPDEGEKYSLTVDYDYPLEAYKLFYRICWLDVILEFN